MKPEITAAVGFLSRFLRVKGHVNDRQVQTFSQSLQDILAGKKTHQTLYSQHSHHKQHAHVLGLVFISAQNVEIRVLIALRTGQKKHFFVLPTITISDTDAHHCSRISAREEGEKTSTYKHDERLKKRRFAVE